GIKEDVQLSSISGGTDIVSCFVLGNPLQPFWRGEIQGAGLGLAVDVWNDDGKPVRGEKGELVCTKAFPSMPVMFWNDPDGTRHCRTVRNRRRDIWRHRG
ncbi:acetoacetate--CoA ligase, partial [Rhizobium johnstonii]